MLSAFTILTVLCVHVSDADNWAILVAGGSRWPSVEPKDSFVDVYQLSLARVRFMLLANGFAPDNIIVMMDDNVPRWRYTQDSIDYHGNLVPDYRGDTYGIDTFKNVMAGGSLMKRWKVKVLKSRRTDNIFFYYAGPCSLEGIFLPDTLLSTDEFQNVLNGLYRGVGYMNMYLVVEGPESGQFLNGLSLNEILVYGVASVRHTQTYFPGYYMQNTLDVHPFTEVWTRYIGQYRNEKLSDLFIRVNSHPRISRMAKEYGNLMVNTNKVWQFLSRNSRRYIDSVEDGLYSVAFRALGFDTEVNEFKLLRQETKDSQGRVDFGEFLSLLSDRMLALDSEMDIGKSFELLDTGNKGYIDINDLRLAAEKLEMPEMYDDDFAAMLLGAQINDPAQELQRFYEERQKQARIRAGKTYGIDATADEMEGHPLPQDIMMSGMPGFQRARRLSSSGQPAPESLTVNLDQFKVLMTMTRPPIEDIKLL